MTKYIITDPCYVLSDEVWDNICSQCEDDDFSNGKFDTLCTEALNKLAGTTNAVACSTGIGDWTNCIQCSNDDKVIEEEFFADSGMVCVVEYNEAIQNVFKNGIISRGGVALIETEGEVIIEMDTSHEDWTIVYIEDDEDEFNSMPYDDDYDEDEDEDDYDEEDEDDEDED
jgi:hypothetical protein